LTSDFVSLLLDLAILQQDGLIGQWLKQHDVVPARWVLFHHPPFKFNKLNALPGNDPATR
jgi:hypothetical protein